MTIRESLSRMAREMCTEADIWVEQGPVVVAANTDYPQVAGMDGEPLRIRWLLLGGRRVRQSNSTFVQHTPETITFSRKPEESLLEGALACRPSPGDMPPDEVVSRWGEVIADGARWRLLMMPQKWQNAELASYYNRQYRLGVASARQLSALGHAHGGSRVKPRRFI